MYKKIFKKIVYVIQLIDSLVGVVPVLITIWISIKISLFKQNIQLIDGLILLSILFYFIFRYFIIIKSRNPQRLLNGNLHVKEYKITHIIRKNSRLHCIKANFISLKGNVRHWNYRLNWTGNEKPTFKLKTKGCKLFGPITEDFDWVHYRIQFNNPLNNTKDRLVSLEIQLPDPHKIAKPIISSRFDQFGKCGKFSITVKFETQPLPHEVYFNIFSLNGSVPLETEQLEPISDHPNIFKKEINQIDKNKRYVINWSD